MVVNFFASWCIPCRKEMPAFQAVSDRVGSKVAFLGIDHQDSREGGLDLVAQTGVRYPIGYDPDGSVATGYGLFGMPNTSPSTPMRAPQSTSRPASEPACALPKVKPSVAGCVAAAWKM